MPWPLLTATAAQVTAGKLDPGACVVGRAHRSDEPGFAAGVLGGDLLEQVGDADLERTAVEVERRLDRRSDVVRVDVAVPRPVAADDDDRVADRPPPLLERLDVRIVEVAEEHHLVALLADVQLAVDSRRAVGDGVERGADHAAAGVRLDLRQRFVVNDVKGGVEQQQIPCSPGVDDAGVAQHGKQVGRLVESRLAADPRLTQDVVERLAGIGCLAGGFGGLPHDGQDRPLDGCEHGGVGPGGRRFQGRGDDRAGRLVGGLQRRRDPAQDLRHDHPAVASGTHQRAVADRIARGAEIGRCLVHLGHDTVEGARHVRTRVAVRHGIHVEPVDPRGVGVDGVAERADRVAKGVDTEHLECWHDAHCRADRVALPVDQPLDAVGQSRHPEFGEFCAQGIVGGGTQLVAGRPCSGLGG